MKEKVTFLTKVKVETSRQRMTRGTQHYFSSHTVPEILIDNKLLKVATKNVYLGTSKLSVYSPIFLLLQPTWAKLDLVARSGRGYALERLSERREASHDG